MCKLEMPPYAGRALDSVVSNGLDEACPMGGSKSPAQWGSLIFLTCFSCLCGLAMIDFLHGLVSLIARIAALMCAFLV